MFNYNGVPWIERILHLLNGQKPLSKYKWIKIDRSK